VLAGSALPRWAVRWCCRWRSSPPPHCDAALRPTTTAARCFCLINITSPTFMAIAGTNCAGCGDLAARLADRTALELGNPRHLGLPGRERRRAHHLSARRRLPADWTVVDLLRAGAHARRAPLFALGHSSPPCCTGRPELSAFAPPACRGGELHRRAGGEARAPAPTNYFGVCASPCRGRSDRGLPDAAFANSARGLSEPRRRARDSDAESQCTS